jgi:hypothetical protein
MLTVHPCLHLDILHHFEVIVVFQAAIGDGLSIRSAERRTRIAADFTAQPDCLSHGRPDPGFGISQHLSMIFQICYKPPTFDPNGGLHIQSADDVRDVQVVLLGEFARAQPVIAVSAGTINSVRLGFIADRATESLLKPERLQPALRARSARYAP